MDREQEKDLISQVLGSFNVGHGDITVTAGPSVTLYEFEPRIGVRMSKIRNLKDEFAVALKASGVRVIAPMPGKGTVGIEVPNRMRETVAFSSMLGCLGSHKDMALPLAIGKTAEGKDFVADLADMPHLLIAGATGQGKSVGLNVILASLLNTRTPDELKLVLVDPKQVELTSYEGIAKPYLAHLDGRAPICTEAAETQQALGAVLDLMEQRYSLLKEKGVRNIAEYNARCEEKMPYYVIVIDEYGDLIMTAEDEMERIICRLAQKARAVGIHMIISTQRPDVSVVTGNIKANFPTRIAFRTTTGTDSRVILDRTGAERLTGKGDMLFFSGAETTRVQCAFISTDEVNAMCERIGRQYDNCEETIIGPKFVPMTEEDIEFGPVAFLRGQSSWKPRPHMLEVALEIADCDYVGDAKRIELSEKLGYNVGDALWGLVYWRILSPGFKVEVHDREKIKRIVEWWSNY